MMNKNITNFVSMIRIDHWFKNIFVFPGIIFAILLTDETFKFQNTIYYLCLLFSICLIASSNYLINEYLNLIVILNVIVFLISTFFDFNNLEILTKSINFD